MQITRQRVRAVTDIETMETCPSCFGKEKVQPTILFTDRLREKIDYVVNSLNIREFKLYVHPYVDAYIKKGLFRSILKDWKKEFGKNFKVIPNQALAYLEYRFFDKDGKMLDVKEQKDTDQGSKEKRESKVKKNAKGKEN